MRPADPFTEPCPWCKKPTEVYLEGSYVDGWTSFVHCSDSLKCGVRGPTMRTPGLSNDNWIIEDKAIEAWNSRVSAMKKTIKEENDSKSDGSCK